MLLYMYIDPGQGLTTPWGRNFDVNRNILSLQSFVASFKKNLWSLILYKFFFMILYMQTGPRGQSFDANRNVLSLRSFVATFKKMPLKSDFKHFFTIKYMHIAPGQGQTDHSGQNFDVNRKALSFYPFITSFKKIFLKSDFIQFFFFFFFFFFHDLIHVYSPEAGGIQPPGDKFWCQQKFLVTSVICC